MTPTVVQPLTTTQRTKVLPTQHGYCAGISRRSATVS